MKFFEREKRYDEWQPLERPLLEDYLELLDGVKRRVARRLMRPEEEQRVKRMIRSATSLVSRASSNNESDILTGCAMK